MVLDFLAGRLTPACLYSASTGSLSEWAIAWSTCSDGALKPRSIWDRYGFEIPAISANWRIENSANSRCWRMISPRVGIELSAMTARIMVPTVDNGVHEARPAA